MASTYTVNLGIEKIGTGEQSGTWGTTTNTNFDLIDQAINGAVTVTLASAGTSGSPNTLAITDGTVSDGRNKFIDFADGGDLGAAAYVQLTPNDAEKLVHIRNSLSGGRSIFVFQGTYNASNDFEIPNGKDVVLKFDGGGATATVTQVFEDLLVTAVAATTVDTTNIEVTNLKAKDGTSAGSIADSTGVVTLASSVLTTTDINGGSVDGVTLGTNSAVTEAQIDNININGNTISSTDTDGNVTITPNGTGSVAISKIDVAGGEIDGTAIGANSASTAVFTNLTASGTVSFSGATVSNGGTVTTVNIDGGSIDGTIIGAASPAAGTFTTVTGTGFASTGDMTFGDNDKAIFGAGSDLQIYHDGSNSYVQDAGDGALILNTTNGGGVYVYSAGETMATFNSNGAVNLYYDNAAKLATTATGIDVTGTITADGLTVDADGDGGITLDSVSASSDLGVRFQESSTTRFDLRYNTTENNAEIKTTSGVGFSVLTNSVKRLNVDDATGDISFYEDTGTNARIVYDASAAFIVNEDGADFDFRVESDTNTHALFVDAGNSSVGINTSSPSFGTGNGLEIYNSDTGVGVGGGTLRLTRGDISSTADDPIGTIEFYSKDADGAHISAFIQSTAQELYARQGDLIFGTAQGVAVDAVEATRITNLGALVHQKAAVFNESGGDNDFRVESDTSTHALFVDASASKVGILNSAPKAALHISGDIISGSNTATQGSVALWNEYDSTNGDFIALWGTQYASGGPLMAYGLRSDGDTSWKSTYDNFNGTHSVAVLDGPNFKVHADEISSQTAVGSAVTTYEYFSTGRFGTIFNEDSRDVDFRVESDTNTHMLFVDAGNDAVGVGDDTPEAPLHVQGSGGSTTSVNKGLIVQYDTSTTILSGGGTGIVLRGKSSGGNIANYEQAMIASYGYDANNQHGLSFWTKPNASTALTEAAHFEADGEFVVQGGATFNEAQGSDANDDFRVRSSGNGSMLFVDASEDHVCIGTTSDFGQVLNVDGGLALGADSTVTWTSNYLKFQTRSASVPVVQLLASASGNYSPRLDMFNGAGTLQHSIDAGAGPTVFNDTGEAAADFRVESDTNTHMLFVDASADTVGIGTSSQGVNNSATLTVNQVISCFGINGGIYFGTGAGGFGTNGAIARASTSGFHITSSVAGDLCIASEPNTALRFGTSTSGTPATRMTIAANGDVNVVGAFSKGSGSFRIDHPLPEKRDTHHLVHSFVEAPQADNIYRGKVDLVAGTATVNIDTVAGMTEGTFALLNREVQCFTSNESGWTAVRGKVDGNILTIEAQDPACTDTISWMVVGERQDQHMYDTGWTDENGKVIVEPLKDTEGA